MKWIDVKQGSEQWRAAHLGLPSASQFERIISPKKLQPSSGQRKYLCELVAERVMGFEVSGAASSLWMERGGSLEAEAARWYELATGREAVPCGFALMDNGQVGASPDRLVGADGLLEIKCPMPGKHLSYLFYGLDDEYRLQIQGQLLVCERQWVDFLSYCPGLPAVEYRIERDPECIKALTAALHDFCQTVDEAEAKLRAMLNEGVAA